MLFACKLGTPVPFLGREAVERARAVGPRQRLVSIVLDDPKLMMWGGELLLRNGVAAGLVTSAAWGAAVGTSVGLAYVRRSGDEAVTPDYIRAGSYEVNVGGRVCGAKAMLRSPYDPGREKVLR